MRFVWDSRKWMCDECQIVYDGIPPPTTKRTGSTTLEKVCLGIAVALIIGAFLLPLVFEQFFYGPLIEKAVLGLISHQEAEAEFQRLSEFQKEVTWSFIGAGAIFGAFYGALRHWKKIR